MFPSTDPHHRATIRLDENRNHTSASPEAPKPEWEILKYAKLKKINTDIRFEKISALTILERLSRRNRSNWIHRNHRAIGVERVKVTGVPDSCTHTVRGSLPTFSVLKPWVLVGSTGKVTGMVALQVFPLAVTVTPVIVLLLAVQERPYLQASRAMRAVKEADICKIVRFAGQKKKAR